MNVALVEINAETVRAVCHLAVAPEQQSFVAPNAVSLAQAPFSEHIDSQTVLVACIGDQVMGSARGVLSGSVCTIRAVRIHPEHQGKGLGSELLRAVERAHTQVARFELLTNLAVPGNVRFYERHGYAVTELRRMTGTIELAFMTRAGRSGTG